jgi:hypothetical protein
MDKKHNFFGKWITDDEFCSLNPRNVFHKQLEEVDLPCDEHRNRHILFRKKFNVDTDIKDAKIYAAGCILPLTQNNTISSDLGTRHRAAIGMSEQSDAVVVIVSEETGYISVAINGKLQRDLKTSNLREILLSNLITNDNKKDKTRKKIRGGNSEK